MAGNQVVLTFAGDTNKLENAFGRVGKSAKNMREDVGRETESMGKTVGRAAAVAGAAVGATMAPALAGALAGGVVLALGGGFLAAGILGAAKDPAVAKAFGEVGKIGKDVLKDFSAPFKGPLIRAATTFGDAIKGMKPALVEVGKVLAPVIDKLAPALAQMAENALPGIAEAAKQAAPAFEALAGFLPTIGTWIGTAAEKLGEFATWAAKNKETIGEWIGVMVPVAGVLLGIVAAIRTWIAVQTILNIVMALNPIGLIIIAVAALVAIIIIIATKTTWFQTAWKAAWGGIKKAASAVGSWFKDTLWGKWIKGAWEAIKDKGVEVWNWMKGLPGKLKSAFAKIANFIAAPFKAAFNGISDAWNNTVGRLSWTVPGWVPGLGGNSVSAPTLPHFHSGGVVPGVPGSEQLAILQAGERISPATSNRGGEQWIQVDLGDLGELLLGAVSKAVGRRGGGVSALGVKVLTNGTVRA